MIDILLPILKSCVQSLCLSIMNAEKTGSQQRDPTQLVVEILNILAELLSVIPRGFFLLCEEIDDRVPRSIIPVRNNVSIHFLVTALYSLLNLSPGIINSTEDIIRLSSTAEAYSNVEQNPTASGTTAQSIDFPTPVSRLEPLLLSVSERLCHLNHSAFDQVVHRLVSQIESM
jgi:hypothetical protein